MTRLIVPESTIMVGDVVTAPLPGSTATLDETTTYATANVTIPLTSDADVEGIDPRDGIRMIIDTSIEGAASRSFDLGVRSREVDHKSRTITLTGASDEALLGDYAPLTTDSTPRALYGSVRDVVEYVLDTVIPGASLEATPADDPDVTPYWELTNELPNPSGSVDASLWDAAVNCSIFLQTGGAFSGSTCIGIISSAAGDLAFYAMPVANRQSVRAGDQKTFRTAFKSNYASGRTVRFSLRWFDSQGNWYTADAHSPVVTITDTAWHDGYYVTGIAPPGAVSCIPYVTVTGSTAASQGYYCDNAALYDGDFTGYFDGDTTDTDYYEYEWNNVAGLSTSIRKPILIERAPSLLIWRAGVSAWEFLLNVCSSVQLRLFCDELRKWRLVPSDYVLPGAIVASPPTSREGTDRIDRDGDLWADGVVIRYRWTDNDGAPREQLDTAGVPGKVQLVDFDQAYPGPGAAAFRLGRLQGQGRTQTAVCFTDYLATPGMEARYTLPGTFDQVGRLQAVTFGLTDGFMEPSARGLTDTPPSAYIYGAPGISYLDVPIGMSYDDFDWSLV